MNQIPILALLNFEGILDPIPKKCRIDLDVPSYTVNGDRAYKRALNRFEQ